MRRGAAANLRSSENFLRCKKKKKKKLHLKVLLLASRSRLLACDAALRATQCAETQAQPCVLVLSVHCKANHSEAAARPCTMKPLSITCDSVIVSLFL